MEIPGKNDPRPGTFRGCILHVMDAMCLIAGTVGRACTMVLVQRPAGTVPFYTVMKSVKDCVTFRMMAHG